MFRKTASTAVCALALLLLVSTTGCFTGFSNFGMNQLGLATVPIPVSPFIQDNLEDNFHMQERYNRVPILPPITSGAPAVARDPPSDDEVMRALERAKPLEGGIPFLHSVHRDNVRIVRELIADHIDPPRNIPLVGPVQLHHARYKCIIYYKETTRVGWPTPYTMVDEDAQEVIYIDHDHFHMVGNVDGGLGSNYGG